MSAAGHSLDGISRMHPLLRYGSEKRDEVVALIRDLVECETPSGSAAQIERFVELLTERTRDVAQAEKIPGGENGPHLRLQFDLPGEHGGKQILVLSHSDTVWPLDILETMPFRMDGGRLWGPGVLDMKGGIAIFVQSMRALRDLQISVKRPVVLLVVSDEEIGSPSSRSVTEAEAQKSEAVLVLEPGTGLDGKLKTSRKGVGHYRVQVKGVAAHAGVDFEKGASAILEAARQVQKIARFTNLRRGVTVNPGLISGGTRSNVIAAEAVVDVDVRVRRLSDAEMIGRRFQDLRPMDARCQLVVEGGINRPPMERTRAIGKLFAMAKKQAAEFGVELEESATGGGSDGNFTAALGVPTLDGLGAVGQGAHAPTESILADRIPDRVALLAALVKEL